jgi:hypothetical protein
MPDATPYYVAVDTNIWVEERLLQSSIGRAFLYAVTGAKSSILLPEVVELEIARVLPDMAEQAVGRIKRDLSLLRQLSGQDVTVTAPSALAIEEGIEDRWKQLSGLLIPVPFTLDQAKSALQRIIRKAPPSGKNNEQFRDCCIWEAVLSAATDRVVHLVSADNAFYEGGNKAAGLAGDLRADRATTRKDICIHSSLQDFLAATDSGAAVIDQMAIGDAITKAIMDQAREIAAKPEIMHPGVTFELGKAHRPKISGYATPKPSLVAISFEASFDLEQILVEDETEARGEATMVLNGVCSYDPATKAVSEIEIRGWCKNLNSSSGGISRGWVATSLDKTALDRQYGPGRTRILS